MAENRTHTKKHNIRIPSTFVIIIPFMVLLPGPFPRKLGGLKLDTFSPRRRTWARDVCLSFVPAGTLSPRWLQPSRELIHQKRIILIRFFLSLGSSPTDGGLVQGAKLRMFLFGCFLWIQCHLFGSYLWNHMVEAVISLWCISLYWIFIQIVFFLNKYETNTFFI